MIPNSVAGCFWLVCCLVVVYDIPVCFPGNQFGEGLEDVIEKMESYGKKDILGPFDENEEPDSDEEEEEEAEEEEEKSDDEGADELVLEIKGIGLSPDSKQLKQDQQITNVSFFFIFLSIIL